MEHITPTQEVPAANEQPTTLQQRAAEFATKAGKAVSVFMERIGDWFDNRLHSRRISVMSHWQTYFDLATYPTTEFYLAIRNAVAKRKVPGVDFKNISYLEGGILSRSRNYLRVQVDRYVFDICAARFGESFFISWWLGEKRSITLSVIAALPLVGKTLYQFFSPRETYYRADAFNMLKASVHESVLEAIEIMAGKEQGFRVLRPEEKQPTDLYLTRLA